VEGLHAHSMEDFEQRVLLGETMKIVINNDWGGFGISKACAERMAELGNKEAKEKLENIKKHGEFYPGLYETARNDPILVQAVEELGTEKASGKYASLKIVEIPDDIEYEIDDYDGRESIHETHRSWS